MSRYDFAQIEKRWQKEWEEDEVFRTPESVDPAKPKYFVLDMFPYPSGAGLHVGHPLGYIATDIVARHKRMQGFNVLHPIGFDAFGLPAEQFAVEHGVHPRTTTERNIENMLGQLKRLGLSCDWARVLATTEPEYVRWTQWIFLQLYGSYFDPEAKAARPVEALRKQLEDGSRWISADGEILSTATDAAVDWNTIDEAARERLLLLVRLAYIDEVPVNWCPALGTVLANEEVTNEGLSERGNYPVFRRPLRQWMLRITAYADRLEEGLDGLDWPEAIKTMQRHWIGRSTGARARFAIEDSGDFVEVFTTRPDTLFGATYLVLAPEHRLVDEITTAANRQAVSDYRREVAARSDRDRVMEGKVKTGVDTGAFAINPVNKERIPVWIADYVLSGYGTGAIMAVPAHDIRDFAFARQFGLNLRVVVEPPREWLQAHGITLDEFTANPTLIDDAFTGEGVAMNSDGELSLDGLPSLEAIDVITRWLDDTGHGNAEVRYKLRDWLFSRQRYWGEPFPILHGPDGSIRPVDEVELPVELPEMEDFRPSASDDPDAPPQPPLGRAAPDWKYVTVDGVRYARELNTMPNWAGSCWYYLRFIDPRNDEQFVDRDLEQYWMAGKGVDLYVGGAEHAVLHLLYARFWHKVLFDLGRVSGDEPFGRLVNQGYIQAYAYRDSRKVVVDPASVVDQDGSPAQSVQDMPDRRFFHDGEPVSQEFGKMGKSLKNTVDPDDVIAEYGCDTLRLYEMYLGPIEQSKPWNTRDIIGVHRFLRRVWRNFVDDSGELLVVDEVADEMQTRLLHRTIDRVTTDIERLSFNTAIAALIEFNSSLVSQERIPLSVARTFVLLLSPLAPHLGEELWSRLGEQGSVGQAPWPRADPELIREEEITIVVQVNGKVRGSIDITPGLRQDEVIARARRDENVRRFMEGKTVRREIYVPGRIVNIVVS